MNKYEKKSIGSLSYVFGYLKKDKIQLSLAIFWSIIFVIIPMQIPILTGALIDGIHQKHVKIYGLFEFPQSSEQILLFAIVGLFLIALGYGVSAYFRMITIAKVSRHFVSEIRKALIQKSISLSLDVHSKYGSGELLNRTMMDTQSIRQLVESAFIKTSTNIVRLAYPLVMLFIIDPYLTLISLSVLPVQLLITRKLQKKLHKASREARTTQAGLTTLVKENLDGIETIQTCNAEMYSIGDIEMKTEKLESDQIKTQKYSGMIAGFVWSLTSIGLALTWWQGGLSVLAGHMTIGTLIVFTGLVLFIYTPSRRFTDVINVYQKGVVALERIQEILDTHSSINDSPDSKELLISRGQIEFQNVSFSYFKKDVLTNINLKIKPNTLTAIVGKSGAGKSSLLKLIPRLYDPSDGQILIDNQNIKKVKLLSLRSHIAVVPQTPMIFSGTVSDNIALAKPHATDAEIQEACILSDILKFSSNLDKGLDTHLGQGGVNLSGGEIQRIAIARALIRKPKILLLDEPSSALDSESESAIMATLDRLKNDMTIIIIGHHMKAISKSDRLVVIDNGEVVQEGTHKDLVNSQGVYGLLYSKDDSK